MTVGPTQSSAERRTIPNRTETLLGIAFMLAGFFFYSFADMLSKVLTQSLHPFQVAWFRQFGLFVGALVLLHRHGGAVLRSYNPGIQITRGLTVVIASSCFVFAVTYVPLADAVAVSFIAPFIVTILGALLLREMVGYRRWIAVFVGFFGTLLILRPGLGVFHPAIFLVFIAAATFALRQIISRFMSGSDSIATTITYSGLTAALSLAAVQPFFWTWPENGTIWLLMVLTACSAGVAEFTIMRALELAETVVVAPLQYTLIIWSTIWGFLIFADLPDLWTVAGATIIIGSGIYTIYRETRRR